MTLGFDVGCRAVSTLSLSVEASIWPNIASLRFHPLAWGMYFSWCPYPDIPSMNIVVGPFSMYVTRHATKGGSHA